VAAAYTGLSSIHTILGNWSRVLYYAERSFGAVPDPDELTRYRYLIQRGIAYYEFGERDEARKSFAQALALAEKQGNQHGVSLANGELGLTAWRFDRDAAAALRHYDFAIEVARRIGVPDLQVAWLVNSGSALRDTGRPDEALRRYRLALEVEEKTGHRRLVPLALKNIGQVLARRGEREEAERNLLEALRIADELNSTKTRWESRMELGLLYASTDADRARRYFSESLDLLEEQHAGVLLESFRAGSFAQALEAYDPYDHFIEFLLDRGKASEAFVIAERSRARAFLDTLAAAREQLAETAPPDFVEAERDLLARISTRQARLRAGTLDAAARREAAAEVERHEEELTRLRVKLATDRPALAHARYPRLPTVDDLRSQVLREGEALALFFLGRERSALWIATRGGLQLARLPGRDRIQALVRPYLEAIQSPDSREDRRTAAAIFSTLGLDRLASAAGYGGRLTVVPHGILSYLPFETLVDGQGRYLVERHAISYAPSAASYAYLRSGARSGGRFGGLLAVGNPKLASGGAPPAAERGVPLQAVGRLKPLEHAHDELRRVASLFRPASRVLELERATEKSLAESSPERMTILHFATHGLIDERRPERSALALTAGGDGEDGILQMREVYGLRLNAALVTLSACQTALGKDVTGEGIVGLSRAFFHAGANAVLASLWSVNDASTAKWMEKFYGEVRRGEPLGSAAQRAKTAFLASDSKLAHPYFWAPFILTGDATAVVPRPPTDYRIVALAVLGIAAAPLALLIARARRRRNGAAPTG